MKQPRDTATPRHIAIIMDGNGRWAKERGLPRSAGHRAGAESVRACVETCKELGVEVLTLYAFSSENWRRPKAEVEALMRLLERFLKDKKKDMMEWDVRLEAIGRLSDLPKRCRAALQDAMDSTAGNRSLRLVLALSYGGREEIVDAMQRVAAGVQAGSLDPESINEETVASHLYTAGLPDPDLLVRTSGELRVSNFLLWQISYAEIVVVKKNWPDFRGEDLRAAVAEYQCRHRRFGGI